MKNLTSWTPPVAISLLLHAAVIVLITHQLTKPSPVSNPLQAITVELQNSTTPAENKQNLRSPIQIEKKQTDPDPIKNEAEAVEKLIRDEAPINPAPSETANSEKNRVNSAENAPTSLNIQPLNKLTRPPAFLRKIEPAYPRAEQRAGSQAYVLAEVTIDDMGKVLEVKIAKSAGTAFDNAVIEALTKSIFSPGYIDKEAVAVRVLVPFRFNLK